jgi:homoserine O-acetyltransferase/O-succinyltransferase
MPVDYETFDLGSFVFQSGATLRDCRLAYKTYGALNMAKDNVIVFPTAYAGDHKENEPRIGPGKALDTDKYFIVVPQLFGNGLSSSPSNTPEPYGGPRFPKVTIYDNVIAQHRLMAEKFGVERIKLVTGCSMGAIQTFHWGALYADDVERIAPYCGAARCSRHNFVFLEGLKAALTADAQWNEGWYKEKPAKGLRAFGRVYAGWAFSQAFYREELDLAVLGHSSIEDFMVAFWEGLFLPKDANDLLCMLWTWQHADVSDNALYRNDFKKALAAIKAKAYVMPSETDLYFPPADSAFEVAQMPNAKYLSIPSIWGHLAGATANPAEVAFIDHKLAELLAS